MKHAAIPTVYNGVQMRSRLEARWAATFDLLGLTWQYEPFDLNGWIPDFVVEDMPVSLYHDIGSEFGEKRRKPFLVEIKPVMPTDHLTSLRAPHDVTNEIEDALGAPRGQRGIGGTWEGFFDRLEYFPVLLGTDPRSGWMFQRHVGWYWIAGRQINDDLADGPAWSWMQNWESIWKRAGNAVQWKRPNT